MFDKEQYKETFSALKASENTLTEVMKMTDARKRVLAKALLAAVAIAAAMTATVFAYGEAIKQFMFGDSSAAHVESVDDGKASHGFGIANRLEVPETDLSEAKKCKSFDEIQPFIPFDVQEPSYMPYDGHWDISAISAYDVYATFYRNDRGSSGDGDDATGSISIFQHYAGPGAYISLESTQPIEKVMVGDIEATALFIEGRTTFLYFLKDEIVFEMFCDAYGLDTLIAVAESL